MREDGDREVEDLRELMRRHGLLPALPAVVPADPDKAEELLRLILARPRRRGRDGQVWFVAAAVVILVVVMGYQVLRTPTPAVAATPPGLGYTLADPAELAGASPAGQVLSRAADVAESASAPSGTGSVQLVSTSGWLLVVADDADAQIYPTRTDAWLDVDGSGRLEQARTAPLGIDGLLDASTGDVLGGERSRDDLPAGTFEARLVDTLSRDPALLRGQLLDRSTCAPTTVPSRQAADCLMHAVQDLYATWVVPDDLTSAVWHVLAEESTVKDMGATSDRLGRIVDAVGLASDRDDLQQVVTVLLISQQTGRLVGTETVTLCDETLGIRRATVTAFQTWLASVRVTEVGARL